MRESSRALPPWREAIRAETQRMLELGELEQVTGACEVTAHLSLRRPPSHWRRRGGELVDELRPDVPLWPVGKPDGDKLLRAVMDGITAGGALADDSIAVIQSVTKEYAAFGQPAGVDVWIDVLRHGPARFTVSDPARDAIAAARANGLIGR